MANKKKHLSEKERFCIEKMLRTGDSLGKIARTLGRGVSTMSEEVSENGGKDKYNAAKAEMRAYFKQYRKKRDCNGVAQNSHVQEFVEKKLETGWSPETISSRLKRLLLTLAGSCLRNGTELHSIKFHFIASSWVILHFRQRWIQLLVT